MSKQSREKRNGQPQKSGRNPGHKKSPGLMGAFYFFSGDSKNFSLEHRLFNSIAFLNAILNITGAFSFIYLESFLVLFALHIGSGLLYLLFWVYSRFYGGYESLYWPFFLVTLVFLGSNYIQNSGSTGGAHYYFIAAALFAVILARKALTYITAFFLFVLVSGGLFYYEYAFPGNITGYSTRLDRFIDVSGNFIFVQIFSGFLVLLLSRNMNLERERSDRLLHNVLPEKIADELKKEGTAKPAYYPSATVLFTDFVGFTKVAEKMSPDELVENLDELFQEFDRITAKYEIEKIKTIGDAYMAAGGIPVSNETHPLDCVCAAIEIANYMQNYAEKKQREGKDSWQIRIGIHTGPLVAGVIGQNKFAYDVWGDTVNLASRMESSGEPGKINVSADTKKLIQRYFETTSRGKIQAKNKGEVEMYFVSSIKERARGITASYGKNIEGEIFSSDFLEALQKKRSSSRNVSSSG